MNSHNKLHPTVYNDFTQKTHTLL